MESYKEKILKNDEIDLIALIYFLWEKRKVIIKYSIIGLIIGFFVAILTPNKYKVDVQIVPQTSNSTNKFSQFSSLASLAGIDLTSLNAAQELTPIIYPDILRSLPFEIELINSKFFIKKLNKEITLYEYYEKYEKVGIGGFLIKYTIGIPSLIKQKENTLDRIIVGDSIVTITKEQEKILKKLKKNVLLDLDEKKGCFTISAIYHDPYLAAQVAKKTQEMLQEYIIRYKIEKAKDKLKFIQERFNEKKIEFEKAQKRLADFRDRNRNITTAASKAEEEKLLSEYNIAFSVYSELAKQLEAAQIQVKEDTPVLTIINPAMVPNLRYSPNRVFLLIIFTLISTIFSILNILLKELKNSKIVCKQLS